ncbi:hypothetical protein T265_03932 [Opisthorchis viverrini]|uniref:Uncharacterized protein n=1 Tax=Opisthorchis viverrini TaxID=6198 RepID=A0A074ZQP3_OPIVI|nr:hypothetical protein T265_03932 [Opisthorchis viverrini]KER29466.1 hypothetical protein T265_03932 [Opisthorchis viverrini]
MSHCACMHPAPRCKHKEQCHILFLLVPTAAERQEQSRPGKLGQKPRSYVLIRESGIPRNCRKQIRQNNPEKPDSEAMEALLRPRSLIPSRLAQNSGRLPVRHQDELRLVNNLDPTANHDPVLARCRLPMALQNASELPESYSRLRYIYEALYNCCRFCFGQLLLQQQKQFEEAQLKLIESLTQKLHIQTAAVSTGESSVSSTDAAAASTSSTNFKGEVLGGNPRGSHYTVRLWALLRPRSLIRSRLAQNSGRLPVRHQDELRLVNNLDPTANHDPVLARCRLPMALQNASELPESYSRLRYIYEALYNCC